MYELIKSSKGINLFISSIRLVKKFEKNIPTKIISVVQKLFEKPNEIGVEKIAFSPINPLAHYQDRLKNKSKIDH